MSAIAISPIKKRHETLRSPALAREGTAIRSLLDTALLQTGSQGVCVYRFDRECVTATLVATAGIKPEQVWHAYELSADVIRAHWNRKTMLVLQSGASEDWRFHGFPEFQNPRFNAVVSLPLLESDTVGLANFCRTGGSPLSAAALSFLTNLSLPLAALLAASALRDQLEKARRDLAGRKLVERAKGLLQARFRWTEEQAYLGLRRLSRQNRIPMTAIARIVIDSGARDSGEALDHHD
jgi:signal transduction protein with GAF and PtsI domain